VTVAVWKSIPSVYADVFDEMNCAVKDLVTICSDPYEATNEAHAIIVATEWDEFVVSINFILVSYCS